MRIGIGHRHRADDGSPRYGAFHTCRPPDGAERCRVRYESSQQSGRAGTRELQQAALQPRQAEADVEALRDRAEVHVADAVGAADYDADGEVTACRRGLPGGSAVGREVSDTDRRRGRPVIEQRADLRPHRRVGAMRAIFYLRRVGQRFDRLDVDRPQPRRRFAAVPDAAPSDKGQGDVPLPTPAPRIVQPPTPRTCAVNANCDSTPMC